MAEIVSTGQAFSARRPRFFEVVIVAIAGAAIVLAIAWVTATASAPKVISVPRTSVDYLQEPGLLGQRQGERGVVGVTTPGQTLSDPGLRDHRRGERGGDTTSAGQTLLDPAMQEHRRGEREGR